MLHHPVAFTCTPQHTQPLQNARYHVFRQHAVRRLCAKLLRKGKLFARLAGVHPRKTGADVRTCGGPCVRKSNLGPSHRGCPSSCYACAKLGVGGPNWPLSMREESFLEVSGRRLVAEACLSNRGDESKWRARYPAPTGESKPARLLHRATSRRGFSSFSSFPRHCLNLAIQRSIARHG